MCNAVWNCFTIKFLEAQVFCLIQAWRKRAINQAAAGLYEVQSLGWDTENLLQQRIALPIRDLELHYIRGF